MVACWWRGDELGKELSLKRSSLSSRLQDGKIPVFCGATSLDSRVADRNTVATNRYQCKGSTSGPSLVYFGIRTKKDDAKAERGGPE